MYTFITLGYRQVFCVKQQCGKTVKHDMSTLYTKRSYNKHIFISLDNIQRKAF